MNKLKDFFEKIFNIEDYLSQDKNNFNDVSEYFKNVQSDAIHCFDCIKKYLKKDQKILEVGGGIHFLTNFLDLEYDITSIEPGQFAGFADKMRSQALNQKQLKVHTMTLEDFKTDEKFDLIFSMNVLEHTDNIETHLRCCINLLKDESSLLLIQCPNYTFPFESHFYKWFIPFMPSFTFKYLRKKSLIKQMGDDRYNNIFNSLNFNCTYFKIKNLNLPIAFKHPLKDIFDRIENDAVFKERLFQNSIVKLSYKLINFLRIKNLLIAVYPKSVCPYLIMEIKK